VIGLQVVTMGRRASEAAREWFADNRYQHYPYLHGLSVEMAEALAEYVHKRMRGEFSFAAEEARDPDAVLAQGYRGSRYSFGYPACPNLADQQQLLALLRAEEIGITLSEEDQLDPEQSTSAIVLHHPRGQIFFSVGGDTQGNLARADQHIAQSRAFFPESLLPNGEGPRAQEAPRATKHRAGDHRP
jgi:5-methyltetrahydrofolate--homocysteine methyltransferase